MQRRRHTFETARAVALGAGFPLLLIFLWHLAVVITGTRLVPSPRQVAVMMYDFTFGGVYDDAFSGTILTHIWKSMQRVYGGFFLAAAIGIPLGLIIGRIKVLRELLDRYTTCGLTYQDFTSSRFVRLRRISELMAAGELDAMLRRPAVVG